MAEAILSTVAGEIIMKLGSFAVQEIGLWCSVKDELGKLGHTVSTIQAVLLQADNQPTISFQRKNYMDKLKEVLYDADDLLDDFCTEALRRQVKNGNKMPKKVCIFANPKQLLYNPKMAQKIKAIREKLDDIQRNRGFHIEEGTVGTQVETSHRETSSGIPLGGVIGRDKEKKDIIKRLLGSNLEESDLVIPIVGFGGLGKTALAQFVFNDVKVQKHFEPKIWVSVSDVYGGFDVKTILKSIIKSVTNNEPEGLGLDRLDQLHESLWKKLDEKRYLLVLDDVWTDNHERWDELKKYLMVGAKGSRIVVTTRAEQVARSTSRVRPYILEGLSSTSSWRLLVKIAFREQEEPTNQHIEIGREIVKKCAGVPLAIRAMGRQLFSRTPEQWRVFNTDLSQIREVASDIIPTLKLSYNNLEPHLKRCFTYCRLFPKDHKFDVETLIYLWIGQGFIKKPSNSRQSLEQVGYEYFLCLLWRRFFQEPEEDEWGNIVCCKMNNLMHDLAVAVAGEESIMLSSGTEITDPKNTRHVSIDDGYDLSSGIPVPLLEANQIRTFLLPCGFSGQNVEKWSEQNVLKFRRLRMLDLHNSHMGVVPASIGKLKHLRYLDLSMNDQLEKLHSSISLLQSLLVLKLTDCRGLKELPEDMKKLVRLELLEIDGCDSLTHMPQGLGELTSLKKLTRFIVSKDHCGGLHELKGLNNLRGELMLENLSHVKDADLEYKAADLERKEHLQTLLLKWGLKGDKGTDEDKDIDVEGLHPNKNLKKLHVFHYPGVRSPNWLSSLSNLVNLKFEDCGKVKYLPLLDGLSSLRDLSIEGLTNLEYIDCNESNCSRTTFFSSLKKLEIRKCPNLKGWRIGSMETSTTSSSSSTTELPPFPRPSETDVNGSPQCLCLSEIELNSFPQLTSMEGFSSIEEDLEPVETSSSTTELPSFPCLSKLQIVECRNVTLMPLFPSIEGDLKLEIGSWKPLQETMRMNSMAASTMSTSSSSTHSLPLSKLKSLHIDSMNDLKYLPDQGMRNLTSLESLQIGWCYNLLSLAGEGFSCLTSLRYLEISYCEKLESVSGVFQHCTGLKELVIRCCQELDFSDGMQFQGLKSLSSLQIDQFPRLVPLPNGLQHVTTLQVLHISRCKNLKNLPNWIGSLTSLQKLYISSCSDLTSLPEGMCLRSLSSLKIEGLPQLVSLPKELQHVTTLQVLHISSCKSLKNLPNWIGLTSLQQLKIEGCPQLSERCGKNTGVDWPKISHIPNIEIDGKKIQSGVCTPPLQSPSNRSITNLISLKQFNIVYIFCFFWFFFMAGWLALQLHFKALNST